MMVGWNPGVARALGLMGLALGFGAAAPGCMSRVARYTQRDFAMRTEGCALTLVRVDDSRAPLVHALGCGVEDDYLPVCEKRTCNVNPVSNARKLAALEAECALEAMTLEDVDGHRVRLRGCGEAFTYRATMQGWAKEAQDPGS